MKQIDNYILEKLHINKDYISDFDDFDSFKEYLENHGYCVEQDEDLVETGISDAYNIWSKEPRDGFPKGYPSFCIFVEDKCFYDEFNRIWNEPLTLYVRTSAKQEIDIKKCDIIKDLGYAYNKKNADVIIKELRNCK